MINHHRFMISAAIGAIMLLPAAAVAQSATAGNAEMLEGPASNRLDPDIVVTAQKREQVLLDVPQSISVISGAALENQQATSFQDYLNLVPGLQLDQSTPGAGRLILRGLNTGGVASTVAVYVDETPFGSSSGLVNGGVLAGDFDTFDIDRVEVLRGPQGTLYGANSLGGLLKFVTKAPSMSALEVRTRGVVETTKGGDMTYRANAVVNLPLTSTLALRASGFYNRVGGFIDSIGTTARDGTSAIVPPGVLQTADVASNINDADSYGGRASLLFKPNDVLDVRLTALLQNIRADAPTLVESDPDTLQTLYGRPTQSQFAEQFTNIDYRIYNGVMNYDVGFATLTSSTSYATQRQRLRDDATFNLSGLVQLLLGAPANDFYLDQRTNSRRFTQEVRLASAPNDIFEWLIGGYYTNEKGLIDQNFVAVQPGTTTPISFPFALGTVRFQSRYKEYAGFANGTLHLGRSFDIDLGGRYSHNKQRGNQSASGALAGNIPVNNDLRSSDNVFTYAVAPKFKINDRMSLYGRVSKGYRPGGPNVIAPNAPVGTPASFDPDTTTSYELGFKGETADRTFGLDIAVFHIDWKNIQLLAFINNFGVNINGRGATSEGGEFTATFRPGPGFVTSINGAYTNARLDADAPELVGGLKNDRLPFTPPYSIAVNADYDWAIGNAKPFIGGSVRFLSKQNANFESVYRAANGRQREVPSYIIVDLRAGITVGRLSIEAFARNLTNDDGKTSSNLLRSSGLPVSPNGALETGVIRPRTIGLSLTAGF